MQAAWSIERGCQHNAQRSGTSNRQSRGGVQNERRRFRERQSDLRKELCQLPQAARGRATGGTKLDGAAARGPERLAEDILLPNRNVDKAFRMTSLLMDDDRVVVGLVRESASGAIEIVGTDGKSQTIDKGQIATRKDTTRSLMPDNFAELINDQDLSHLLQFITQH